METTTGYLDHNNGRLYWEAAGAGHPLLFVHGFSLDTTMWDDQWEPLAAHYRVIRYDCRGFGKSSTPTGPYSHMDDIAALLDAQGVGRAHIVGLSMGARIAGDFALAHPQRTAKLVLMDGSPSGATPSPSFAEFNAKLRENVKAGHLNSTKEMWVKGDLFAPACRNQELRGRLRTIAHNWSGWHWYSTDPAIALDPPAMQRLKDLPETLVLYGELDMQSVHDAAAAVAIQAPNCRTVAIPDTGHMANMEAPAQVNAALLEFLRA